MSTNNEEKAIKFTDTKFSVKKSPYVNCARLNFYE